MAQNVQQRIVPQVATPQHYTPPTARELRAQAVQRLQVGLFGLAAMLLLGMLAILRGNPWYALPAVWGLLGVYVRQIQSPLAGATVAALVALALAVLLVAVALKYALSPALPPDPP